MIKRIIVCICCLALLAVGPAGCNSPTNESPPLSPTPDMQATPTPTDSGSNINAGEPTPEPTKEVLKIAEFRVYDGSGFINPNADKYLEMNSTDNKTEKLNVPVYDHENLFFLYYESYEGPSDDRGDWVILLGTDYSYNIIEMPVGATSLARILTRVPEGAIRVMPENDIGYVMYDTDGGVRLYHFFEIDNGKVNRSSRITGYAALMSEKLSYSDYKGIKKGDELRSLASIDPAMETYADYFYGPFLHDFDDDNDLKSMLNGRKEYGLPVSTVSILSDGALKIGLDYIDGKFVVDTIEFSENFTLECYGGEICYRIAPVDYVE